MTIKTIGLTSRARLQHVLSDISYKNGPILDAGCGAGELLVALRLRGLEVIGLDRDIEQLENLSTAVRQMGERCDLVAADISHLPFRNSSLETVYCMEVINMLENDQNALTEFARVLEPNGTCTISVPNEAYPLIYDPLNRLLKKFGLQHRQLGIWSPGVRRLYRSSDLLNRLRHLNLNPVSLAYIGKWLIPILENYISLLLYYKILASRFRTRYAFRREPHSPLITSISNVLDRIIQLDNMPDLAGTHIITRTEKI
jgi:SAM-dependent methyltransferase